MLKFGAVAILVGFLGTSPTALSAQASLPWTHLGAEAQPAQGGGSVPFEIRLESLTTDQQFGEYGGILWDQGNEVLMQRLVRARLGTLTGASGQSAKLAVVRLASAGTGHSLLLIAAEPVPFLEPAWGGPSSDPLTVFQLSLDQGGVGEGIVYRMSGLDFNEDGTPALDSSGSVVLKVVRVKPMN